MRAARVCSKGFFILLLSFGSAVAVVARGDDGDVDNSSFRFVFVFASSPHWPYCMLSQIAHALELWIEIELRVAIFCILGFQ